MENNKNEILKELQPKKSNKKVIFIVIGAITLFLAIGFGIIYYLYQKGTEYQNEQLEYYASEREMAKQNLFSVSEFDAIPDVYKEHIYYFLEYNNFLDGTYFLTKISDRATKVFAFGDFTDDDNDDDDLAVLFEKNDFKGSKLVIFNHKGELLYVEDFEYDLPTINSFRTGSKIFMDKLELERSPVGGLIIQKPYQKQALVYDKNEKRFVTYHQYSKEELEDIKNQPEYDYEEYEETEVSTEAAEVSTSESDFTIQEVK